MPRADSRVAIAGKRFLLCPYHADGLGWDACSDLFEGCQVEAARAHAKANPRKVPRRPANP